MKEAIWGILAIVFIILHLKVLFKILSIGNNVKEINETINLENEVTPQIQYYVKKQIYGQNVATEYLKAAMEKEMLDILYYSDNEKEESKLVSEFKDTFESLCKDAGITLPTITKA